MCIVNYGTNLNSMLQMCESIKFVQICYYLLFVTTGFFTNSEEINQKVKLEIFYYV